MTNANVIYERITALLGHAERHLPVEEYQDLCRELLERVEPDATDEQPAPGDSDWDSTTQDDEDILADDDDSNETDIDAEEEDATDRRYNQRQHRFKD